MTRWPKVFISHASEDKERFATQFAERLQDASIEVWFDKWEMMPGDNLIDKIFGEGIEEADAFIIVLSKNSIAKPWVKEELDAGLIKRIAGKYKIIPVVIDECKVPLPLRATFHVKIHDLNSYDEELESIIAAIFRTRSGREVGNPPQYTQVILPEIQGFTQIDMQVLKCFCELSAGHGHSLINTDEIMDKLGPMDIGESQIKESLEIFDEQYYIDGKRTLGSDGIEYFSINPLALDQYFIHFEANYGIMLKRVLAAIINDELNDKDEIASHIQMPVGVTYQLLQILQAKDYIDYQGFLGGSGYVSRYTTKAKRFLSES